MTPTFKLSAIAAGATLLLVGCGSSTSDSPASARAPQFAASATTTVRVAADYNDVLQRIYIGYFGRPADYLGQAYWAAAYRDKALPTTISGLVNAYASDANVRSLLDVFGTSQESIDLYPGDNGAFVNAIYRNLFNRDAEDAGKKYWADAITSGAMTRPIAALSIMAGSQGTDLALIDAKTAVAASFTSAIQTSTVLNASTRPFAYSGAGTNVYMRNFLGSVTATSTAAGFQARIDAAVGVLAAAVSGGGSIPLTAQYRGFNYLQGLTSGPQTVAQYSHSINQVGANAGTLSYGPSAASVSFVILADKGISYGAPVSYGVVMQSNPSDRDLPAVAMICAPVANKGSSRGKSTDVLVAASAAPITSALSLAGKSLTTYREDCVLGGVEPQNGAGQSFTFDAAGNATVTTLDGSTHYSADVITKALNGTGIIDAAAGKFTAISAYSFTRIDGVTAYAIVVHYAPTAAGSGGLGVVATWTQE
jgi:hypothetical protein